MVEAAPDGIVMVDPAGVIVLVNQQAVELFGYDRDDLLGMSVENLLPLHLRDAHDAHRARYASEPHKRPMGLGLDLVGRRRDGREIPVEISLSHLDAGGERRYIAVVRDITERRAAEALLRDATNNLQLLQDRERIARDLHDLVIQRLFAAGMALQATVSQTTDPAVAKRVGRVIDDLDDTIRQLRSVIFGLHEHATSSLRTEITRVVADERAALGFEPQLRFAGPVDTLGGEVADHLLLTLREALSNVARHAGASTVEIDVVATSATVSLRVSDDGIGITAIQKSGNGLPNMRARANDLGGTCTATPGPSGGTLLQWDVPITPS